MGSIGDTPSMVYPAPLDPARPDKETPSMVYPAPLDPARPTHDLPNTNLTTNGIDTAPTIELSAPILIVGGGPVGMIAALLLSRLHTIPAILLERASTTTTFPKMEFTNGRSLEIYRRAGLSEAFHAMTTQHVPLDACNDELIVSSLLGEKARLLHTWKRDSAEEQVRKGKEGNDGTGYLESHVRCHQIEVERWLRGQVEAEETVRGYWGVGFLGLREEEDEEGGNVVVSEARRESDGARVLVRSKYVIGCDGGGSWVRKSVGLESRRNYLEMTMAFAHFRSAALKKSLDERFPPFWHVNLVGGGLLVAQNTGDLYTAHYMVPPGVDASVIPPSEIILKAVEGCQPAKEEDKFDIDEIYCKGLWKVEVAIADAFRSAKGNVFLAGDAAHQLSPVGGHGLNSGIGDVFDLAWKIAAVEKGWGGEDLLASYDQERRKIAFENLDHVQQALGEVAMPMFTAHMKCGVDILVGEGEESEKARAELDQVLEGGKWLHNQNGNILGMRYKESPILVEDDVDGESPACTNELYVPSTWPGARLPHVWMRSGSSTLDQLDSTSFNIIDFSEGVALSQPFVVAARALSLPLKVLSWSGEEHVRKIFERDIVLVRPDGHVAWRGKADGKPVSVDNARNVLERVTGHAAE